MAQKTGIHVFAKYLSVIFLGILIPVACAETNFTTISAFTKTEEPSLFTVKKWQVGRVSRKHYEIVNMLWRKTKIFAQPQTTTPSDNRIRRNYPIPTVTSKYENAKPLTLSSLRPLFSSSTPSYIEFYYLDDNDERVKRRDSLLSIFTSHKTTRKPSHDSLSIRSPILSVHVNDRYNDSPPKINLEIDKDTPEVSSHVRRRPVIHQKPSIYGFLSNKFQIDLAPIVKLTPFVDNSFKQVSTEHYINNETCPLATEPEVIINSTTYQGTLKPYPNVTTDETISVTYNKTVVPTNTIESTTSYDRIKFFEMYDQYTMMPFRVIDRIARKYDSDNMVLDSEIEENKKVKLEDVDRNIGHHDGSKTKYVKKHIDKDTKSLELMSNKTQSEQKHRFKTVVFHSNKTNTKNSIETTQKPLNKIQNDTWLFLKNASRVAMLSEYPFAAVYVYEPSQIHCDAAALSPHWLIAAGSCLSRFHRKDPLTEGRSAFVTYCGQNWWQPERVSYVKYSIVHPRFHPKDATRRVLYNIGLVQVVGSMSTCFGWAPISLMSHDFAADSEGSIATAVGWGLDRYDVRYTSVELPKRPLSAYDGIVYSTTCPGSKFLGKMNLFKDQTSAVKNNLYCLALPPYSGEERDPVHGSLLLVGGKLIALYLQEERRFWGEQSAQYTSVWRLVPWVHEVAREPDDGDGFAIDI